MTKRRLLAAVIALCLLLGMIAPGVSAAHVQKDALTGIQADRNNNRFLSGEKSTGVPTLRDENGLSSLAMDGKWIINATNEDAWQNALDASLPACIEELHKAAQIYKDSDIVSAFVVLESAPLIETYSSIDLVPKGEQAKLEQQQQTVINNIETNVLAGQKLDITDQFTYITNSVIINTEFGNLTEIAKLPGVKSVFLTPVYQPCQTQDVSFPYTVSSGAMSNVPDVWNNADLGYTGTGMTIAILDTGLDMDHPSFAADPELNENSWTVEYVASKMDMLNATLINENLTAEDLYYSAKVPFTFDYVLGTVDVNHDPNVGDHGSHVAGIAGANAVEGSNVVGMAPDAQIIVMKVFSPTGGAYMNHILAALEDAMALGCDVANLSLGSAAGFSSTDTEIDAIFARIADSDIIVDIAAGNEGTSSYDNMWDTDLNPTDQIDNGTISSPATYQNAMSVASVDNKIVPGAYFTLADGHKVFYMDSVEYLYGETYLNLMALVGENLDYVIVPGLGTEEDFAQVDVAGKVAVVKRGDLSFAEKCFNAEANGAIACLIWNNKTEDIFTFGMTTAADDGLIPSIPVALITLEDGQKMADAAAKYMCASEEVGYRTDANGGQMSSFSSWGVTPDLRLVPDISGVGGNVYSCYDNGMYGIMSGTSMASPQVAGVTALVLQYLREQFPDATEDEVRMLADSLMMSTAVPVVSNVSGVEASTRQQGAGLVNALYAITSEAYLTVKGSERPKAELLDDEDGVYTFTFSVVNYGDTDKTYTLTYSLLAEDFVEIDGKEYMAGYDRALSGEVTFDLGNTITVAAGQTVTVKVSIALSDEDRAWMDAHFANGNYVEGFVYLNAEADEGVDLSLPFMGFYGDWTDAPLFDTAYWYDQSMWDDEGDAPVTGSEYWHVLWTDLQGTNWVLGFNPYTGAVEDANGNVYYDPANNTISNNGDGLADNLSDIYLSLMRNAKELNLVYTDERGVALYSETVDHVAKTMYISGYGTVVPYIHSWYFEPYDFTDIAGNPLPDGTKLTLNISGVLDYEGSPEFKLDPITITLDNTAPTLVGEPVESTVDGKNYVTITVADNALAYVAIMNPSGTRYLAEYGDLDFVKNGDGTYTVTLDVTGLGNDMLLLVADYGCNESAYDLTYSTDNMPVMDLDALYAYRVHDSWIEENVGYDFQFGWTTIDKTDASVETLTVDAYEYYALTAAEYAGGYVFAVDAGYNFLVMEPGLWNRQIICNLGVNVCDMAFDETTNTMYLAAKAESYYGDVMGCLYTIDLMTGDLELLYIYDSIYDMPYAMTVVDGQIYAVKYYDSGLYVTSEDLYYELVPATDADGNDVMIQTSTGAYAVPYYSQSMTYSKADGKIYWAYYSYSGMPELFTIDPTDCSYTSVPFETDSEYVGLLTLEDDGYTLPEAEGVESLRISTESLVLLEGESSKLTAAPVPWNADVDGIVWMSDNEDVAVVDENGVVTAVSEGFATIIAVCGDAEAYCDVSVVRIQGTIYTYNYFNGTEVYGDWISIDLADMSMQSLYASPVDFITADYNGHTGKIYGYDMNGQFYSFDPVTGDCFAIGAPVNKIPMDMAYDYSTGFMYAITIDQMAWTTTLHYVNMNTGAMSEVATTWDVYMTLACDLYGTLYAISSEGILYCLFLYEDSMGGGGGIMPWSQEDDWYDDEYDDWYDDEYDDEYEEDGEVTWAIEAVYVMEGFGSLQFQQSMCYDHNTDKLVWTSPELGSMYWIDPYAYTPYAVALGDPTGSGLIEFVGMYVIPEYIPELEYAPVTSVDADDILVMAGGVKMPSVTVSPLNATNQAIVWTSADESIAYINESGAIVGVKLGTTTITGVLVDEENTFEVTFTVTVKESTGSVYGYVLTDIATYSGLVWAEIMDTDPSMPGYLEASMYTIYSQEYVDGYIYAYGFDGEDWEANWQFMTIDPETFAILDMQDLGEGFPFVYDITYDYTTGTMYALAGPDDNATDLYMVNMATGALIPVMQTEPFLMSIAATADGTLYAIASSEEEFDPMTWETTYGNAIMYVLDVEAGTCEPAFDTGVKSNMLASMTYDYETGNMYWSALFNNGAYTGGLYLIDLESQAAYSLGSIGTAGSQVSGLYTISDPECYPEAPTDLRSISLMTSMESVSAGDELALSIFAQPSGLELELVWSSSDETVATVDENGVVTAIAPGVATIVVSATSNGKTFTASCVIVVFGEQDYFLSYNTTNHGWAKISRGDTTAVEMIMTDEENLPAVRSAALIDGVIYGYDVECGFFTVSEETGFERTYLGKADYVTYEDTETEDYYFEVRDLTWDGERLLAIGCESVSITEMDYWGDWYTYAYELSGGTAIYEVDLQTGALTLLAYPMTADGYEVTNVYAIAADANGVVYIYSTYDDYISSIDLETGLITKLNTLSHLSIYGGSDGEPMAMTYDPITMDIYLLMTQNGNYYRMFSFDTVTNALEEVGNVGQTEYDDDAWAYLGDSFAGLLLDAVHTHVWGDWTVTAEATCTEDGEQFHVCYCGEIEAEAIPATGHSFGEWEETKAPSCTEEGEAKRSCECGETETKAIPANGHSYESVVTAPTCTEKGYTTHTCECGDSYVDTYVDATGHSFGEWEETKAPSCTEEGEAKRSCECGETETKAIPANGHSYESVVTAPTCTEKGYTTHTCECGDSYVDTYVDATGHSFGEWKQTKAPSCTEAGVKTHECACGETEEEAIPATGHKYNSVVTAPTVDAEGFTTHTCEHCGDSYVDSITEKLPQPDPDNSKTGDSTMIHLWILGMLCSVVALGTLVIYRKRSYKA